MRPRFINSATMQVRAGPAEYALLLAEADGGRARRRCLEDAVADGMLQKAEEAEVEEHHGRGRGASSDQGSGAR
jgi:hypothetical protein